MVLFHMSPWFYVKSIARRIIGLGSQMDGKDPEAMASECLFRSLGTVSVIGPRENFSLLQKH